MACRQALTDELTRVAKKWKTWSWTERKERKQEVQQLLGKLEEATRQEARERRKALTDELAGEAKTREANDTVLGTASAEPV